MAKLGRNPGKKGTLLQWIFQNIPNNGLTGRPTYPSYGLFEMRRPTPAQVALVM